MPVAFVMRAVRCFATGEQPHAVLIPCSSYSPPPHANTPNVHAHTQSPHHPAAPAPPTSPGHMMALASRSARVRGLASDLISTPKSWGGVKGVVGGGRGRGVVDVVRRGEGREVAHMLYA